MVAEQCEHGMPRPGGKTPFCPTCGHGVELGGVHEVAARLGVTRQRVYQLIASYPDFPRPAAELAIGRVWRLRDVDRWMQRHPQRPPGRRPRQLPRDRWGPSGVPENGSANSLL